MAAFTTVLTEVTTIGNKRTYSAPAHTLSKQAFVVTVQKYPSADQTMAEFLVQVQYGTEDANGDLLAQKVLLEAKVRRPKSGIAADFDAALVVFRDLIASDEFTNSADTIEPLQ